jgi:hypothetical protein
VPTFALVSFGGTTLGPFEIDDDEAHDGAIIRRERRDRPARGRPHRRG